MEIINARSPKYITQTITDLLSSELRLTIWNGDVNDVIAEPNFIITKNSINDTVTFEVAELISDFIDVNFKGDYQGQAVWVKSELTNNIFLNPPIIPLDKIDLAVNGYTYFEDPNENFPTVLMSNNVVFILEGETFNLPVYVGVGGVSIGVYKKGILLFNQTFAPSDNSSENIKYLSIGDFKNTYADRVIADGGVVESENCLSVFDDIFNGADEIKVYNTTIKIKNISECKFEPKKITFVNKFGALQDMFFFKKSVEKIAVKKESYRANTINAFGVYDTSQHTQRDFNITADESITLNSGYLSEEYNEVFKQLMLSEKVWLTNYLDGEDQVIPVNVKSKGITYKTSVNDRLVDYAIEFENSFNVINNIR